ncbi:MAG: GNAT family N-acetyltransferase [Planctomycetota bacterium]|jgi:phosphinothricin acetyltransferase
MTTVRKMADSDWPMVAAIYAEGIDTGDATFEQALPTWEQFDSRHTPDCRLVAEANGRVLGWAVLGPVSSRPVYRGVAEVSVYVKASARGQGIGRTLLTAVIKESERAGYWTLQAGIFPENATSLTLHQHCGFRMVGYRERLGQMHGLWRDVVLLERRSEIAGLEGKSR